MKISKGIANSVCRSRYKDNKEYKQNKKSKSAKDESEKYAYRSHAQKTKEYQHAFHPPLN
ncbi:MAG: hypothetical protein ACRDF4_05335 [Rhabdochlamydiaceae bacterium]